MAVETKKSRSSTPIGNSGVNNLSFSVDSLQLGDSTRSLLLPLNDSDNESLKQESFYSENEELSEGEIADKSISSQSSSEDDRSETGTVRKSSGDSPGYGERSERSSSPQSSYSFASFSRRPTQSTNDSEPEFHTETGLSPWEKWLLSKVIKDRERARNTMKKRQLVKEVTEKEIAEKMEKERRAELKRKEWLQLKDREEKIRNELKRREEDAKVCREQEEKEMIKQKAEESYRKWFELKEHKRKASMRNRRKEESAKREKECERKQRSEEAYKEWLDKVKSHRKSTNNHFGYLSGKITGYYDWTCYPMPSYNNPNPWVSTRTKKTPQGKLELQKPSPPLLFKEIEERERNAKQNKSKLKKAKKIDQ